jgi:hypothetical protein
MKTKTIKLFLATALFAVTSLTSAMAQNERTFVTVVDEGRTYNAPVVELPNGGAMIRVRPADIVNDVTDEPAGIRVITGPSVRRERDGVGVKICLNENNWPCMIIWKDEAPNPFDR